MVSQLVGAQLRGCSELMRNCVNVISSVGIKLKELGGPLPQSGTPSHHKRGSEGFSSGEILKSEIAVGEF